MKFQIGDRVRCSVDSGGDVLYGGPRIGQVGTLVAFRPGKTLVYGVKFDDWFHTGHDLMGYSLKGHGWWCSEDALEIVNDPDIVITDLDDIL